MSQDPVPVSGSFSELEEFLHEGIETREACSIAYGVSQRGETLLKGAFGLADKERGIPATVSTPYSQASITKPMTATAVALLADRALVDLDEPINRYLGDAQLEAKAGDADEATVRRVCNHLSGLPLHYQFFYEDEPFRRPPMPETIRRYGKLYSPPGERYEYSNLGYGVLDYLIDQVSGTPYTEFMASEVFGPLGMANASIGAQGGEAIAYGPDGVGYPRYGFDHPGASAAYASVEDLLRFGESHLGLGRQVLTESMRLEMQREAEGFNYVLGWVVNNDFFGLKAVTHSGGMGGVNTTLLLVPEHQLVVAMLANSQCGLPFRGAENAVGTLLPEMRELLETRRAEKPEPPDPDGVPSMLWRSWTGEIETYAGKFPLCLAIRSASEATATLNGEQFPVHELKMVNGAVRGTFEGQVQTPDASRRPHHVRLQLWPRDGGLSGAAMAVTVGEDGGAPGKRIGNALTYWARLA